MRMDMKATELTPCLPPAPGSKLNFRAELSRSRVNYSLGVRAQKNLYCDLAVTNQYVHLRFKVSRSCAKAGKSSEKRASCKRQRHRLDAAASGSMSLKATTARSSTECNLPHQLPRPLRLGENIVCMTRYLLVSASFLVLIYYRCRFGAVVDAHCR